MCKLPGLIFDWRLWLQVDDRRAARSVALQAAKYPASGCTSSCNSKEEGGLHFFAKEREASVLLTMGAGPASRSLMILARYEQLLLCDAVRNRRLARRLTFIRATPLHGYLVGAGNSLLDVYLCGVGERAKGKVCTRRGFGLLRPNVNAKCIVNPSQHPSFWPRKLVKKLTRLLLDMLLWPRPSNPNQVLDVGWRKSVAHATI